ncbi:hypothetical protein C5Y96_07065 [Blastopirellula marina]|uniref:Uncharacterized protein n=1 Tax=Blastopirellula marina TaxID=124 RepID=A0A2S8FXL9_9BACT|nr:MULTISPECIES: hypothetical protein [Pirellulaceae]PQO36915.1 hypothetical protein C5Y96_07065 [Blastopirellula marina]RCS53630.1 hypothetical protein DTL36_07075 [Bremerella cremea]
MDEHDGTTTFRLKTSFLYQGVGCSLFFLIVTGIYLGVLQSREAAHLWGTIFMWPVLILGVMLFGGVLIVSIYGWVSYNIERLSIQEDVISLRSVTQDYQFDVADVHTLVWPVHRPDSFVTIHVLKIHVSGAIIKLGLKNYSNEDQLAIIRFFRNRVPASQQQDWPAYCFQSAIPLRDKYLPNADVADKEKLQRVMKRRMWAPMWAVVICSVGALGMITLDGLGVDKLMSSMVGITVIMAGVISPLIYLAILGVKLSTEVEQMSARLWDEGEAELNGVG